MSRLEEDIATVREVEASCRRLDDLVAPHGHRTFGRQADALGAVADAAELALLLERSEHEYGAVTINGTTDDYWCEVGSGVGLAREESAAKALRAALAAALEDGSEEGR